jgi:tRNA (cytidine/uridine-2'-O-)-methyltransferase
LTRVLFAFFFRFHKTIGVPMRGQFGAHGQPIGVSREPGKRAMRLALYAPDIPQNTGTMLRMAACLRVPVDVVGPVGFDMTDRALRRAALDYMDHVEIIRHESFAAFDADRRKRGSRLVLLTSRGSTAYTDFAFGSADTLMVGRESAGVPDWVRVAADAGLRIPMQPSLRSLNVAIASAMVLGEALRQTAGFSEI